MFVWNKTCVNVSIVILYVTDHPVHTMSKTTVKIIGRRNITEYNKQLAIHNMIAHNQVHLQKIIKIMLPGSLDCLIFGFSHVDLDDNGCCILSKIRCGHCYTHICESCHFINM